MANAFGLKTSCCAITATLAYVKYASIRRFACATFLAPKALRQIENPWFFGTNSGSVYEPLMLEVRFLFDNDNGDSRVCQIRFNPPFRLRHVFSSKMDSLAWLRYAGAGRAGLRGGQAPCGDWQSQCAYPQLPIASLIPYGVKCCRILSFPKALFYSLAVLRIK